MNDLSPATLAQAPVASASAILAAAGLLLPALERGQYVDSAMLRTAMETAFGGPDASGLWDWKAAYEACEVATVLFLRKFGRAIFRKAATPAARLKALLRASLPVFDSLTETIRASNVTVGTDKGTFGADALSDALNERSTILGFLGPTAQHLGLIASWIGGGASMEDVVDRTIPLARQLTK